MEEGGFRCNRGGSGGIYWNMRGSRATVAAPAEGCRVFGLEPSSGRTRMKGRQAFALWVWSVGRYGVAVATGLADARYAINLSGVVGVFGGWVGARGLEELLDEEIVGGVSGVAKEGALDGTVAVRVAEVFIGAGARGWAPGGNGVHGLVSRIGGGRYMRGSYWIFPALVKVMMVKGAPLFQRTLMVAPVNTSEALVRKRVIKGVTSSPRRWRKGFWPRTMTARGAIGCHVVCVLGDDICQQFCRVLTQLPFQ